VSLIGDNQSSSVSFFPATAIGTGREIGTFQVARLVTHCSFAATKNTDINHKNQQASLKLKAKHSTLQEDDTNSLSSSILKSGRVSEPMESC